jgi:hypothetical protein
MALRLERYYISTLFFVLLTAIALCILRGRWDVVEKRHHEIEKQNLIYLKGIDRMYNGRLMNLTKTSISTSMLLEEAKQFKEL